MRKQNQKNAVLLVEGQQEFLFFEKILPKEVLRKILIVVANGNSYMLSKAMSIVSYWGVKVIIVADAETTDDLRVIEKRDFIESMLRRVTTNDMFKVVLIKPTLEALFFRKTNIIEKMLGRKLTEVEQERAKYNPKENLNNLFDITDAKAFFRNIDCEIMEEIRNLEEIQEIMTFIEAEKVVEV
ncbi:MAG: hypothetical protein ACPG5B_02795 [Chitinophagales bacterium]